MKKILILNTGGTFNKVYNEITGQLDVSNNCETILDIINKSYKNNLEFDIKGVIFKDSLELTYEDRELIVQTIKDYKKVVIVHGTDTIDMTAKFIDNEIKNKLVVLTGSMMPYSINSVEATANLIQSITYANITNENGVYISMHGLIEKYDNIIKNRELGIFSVKN